MGNTNASPAYNLYDCMPSREQTWLLHAAVSDGDNAIACWQKWRDKVDLDATDPASFRLLPLAYRNMADLGQDDALVKRLKGIYRHTWYKNQILYRQAEGILAVFQQAKLPVLMLKGAALIKRFYNDDAIRFMDDIDLMVPQADYERAASLMLEQGWQPSLYSADVMFWYHRHQHKHGCALKKNNVEIDLHSRLFRFVAQDDQALWDSSIKAQWRGYELHFLNDTEQLFHTCVHGMRWSYGYLSWIPDALTILASDDTQIDWQLLVEKARQTRTLIYLYNALAYLAEVFQAAIPSEVLSELSTLPVSWAERQEYKTLAREQTGSPVQLVKRVLLQSSRSRATSNGSDKPIALSLTAWAKFLIIHAHLPGWR